MTTDTTTTLPTPSPTRPGRIGAAISALIQAVLLIVGLPLLLVRGVGWPLPHHTPQWVDVQRAYQLRYLPDRFVIGALACAGWICWTMIVASLIHGAVAHIRATNYRRPRLVLPGVHGLVGRWISAATLTVTLLARPAGAAPVPARAAVAQSVPVDTIPAGPAHHPRATVPTVVRVEPVGGSTSRTIVTGEHQTYWDIAESTLGDGQRWREILNANPNLGMVDLVPAGITLNIPATHQTAGDLHVVDNGDNLWKIAATELAEAHDGTKPTNAQIVPYWHDVIDTNEPGLRSGNPNLIYPGETVHLPLVDHDQRAHPPAGVTDAPATPAGVPAIPTENKSSVPPTTRTAPSTAVATTAATDVPASGDVVDDVDTDFHIPWLQGLAITGIAAAGILAAWHTQRRRRIRAHKPGDPIPVLSEPDREVISQLRAIAAEHHHAAVDTAFRYLATTIGDEGTMPSITVARAGRHSVELLLDDAQTPTPAGFLRLDQQTIVINPGIPDEDIATATAGRKPPAPGLVALGADDIGTVVVDLERTAALAIEAATDIEAVTMATALLTELATQPWGEGVTVLVHGLPATIDPEGRITHLDQLDALIDRAEEHIQAQTDDVDAHGTHTIRCRNTVAANPLVIVLGPGVPDTAKVLAAAANQPGSALALICCDAIANSAWRLVTTNGRTTLEPTGLTVAPRHLRASTLDNEANKRLAETFGHTTTEPATTTGDDAAIDETDHQHGDERPAGAAEKPDALGTPRLPLSDRVSENAAIETHLVVEEDPREHHDSHVGQDTPIVHAPTTVEVPGGRELAKSNMTRKGFDQLTLIDEPIGDTPPEGLSIAAKIDHIMRRRTVELVLLDGPPRIEGVIWNGKDAARADEIVAFLALNGPSTLSQVATAIWPDKVRPGDIAKQMVSRARKTLGLTDDGHHRISPGSRSAPYRLVDVGCDWHRFEQLCRLAVTEDANDRPRLLRAALSLVRTPPFDVTRPGAFHWASDLCFDSRMRLKISEAARHVEGDADNPDSDWARNIRLSVTHND